MTRKPKPTRRKPGEPHPDHAATWREVGAVWAGRPRNVTPQPK